MEDYALRADFDDLHFRERGFPCVAEEGSQAQPEDTHGVVQ